MPEDKELELLTAKKLLEIKRRLTAPKASEKTDREVVVDRLVNRGVEVLEAAERMYPQQTAVLVKKIAGLIRRGAVKDVISGGELLQVFRSLGLRVRIETYIAVEKHGKLVPLAEKLRAED